MGLQRSDRGRGHHIRLLAGREESVVAHSLRGKTSVLLSAPHLHSEHPIRTRVSWAHEDPEALTGEAVEDNPIIAGLEQHGVAAQHDPASRQIAVDAARRWEERAYVCDGVHVVQISHVEVQAPGHASR